MSILGQPRREVEITIAPDGTTTVAAVGCRGPECRAATAPYERALGAAVADRETDDMRLAPAEALRQAGIGRSL